MWGAAVGVLLMATGVVLVAIGSRSLDAATKRRADVLRETFVTSPESPHLAQFERAAAFGVAMDEPIVTSFFLFNLTNAGDVVSGRARPQVSEIGPYTYEKTARKVNVTFHATLPGGTENTDYAYVSYRVETAYAFVPQRSNGSEEDVVVTLNATYARTLAKYRQFGYSERLMVADFAHRHLQSYHHHLREEFVAHTKQRALQFFLPNAIDQVRKESVAPAIRRQRERVDSASIPRNLVQMYAVARQEAIPQVLTDVMKDVSDKYIPEILRGQLDAARDHALPRVMSNLLNRLKVEAVPVLLEKQIDTQYLRQVPKTLNSLYRKLPQLAFPYVMQEVFDRACLEAVPFILRSIKLEIIARDIADNRVQADVAQNNVIEAWRKRTSATPVDFDAWIDDNPTGQPRTGFELRPSTSTLEISKEVATLLLGSKSSNKRFSVVDYDAQTAASYTLDRPTETPVGFGIWKQVIAMNETAIAYLIANVNYDVALPSDYITRSQVLFIRDYLIQWAQRDVVKRDRERFWRQNYAKRTTNSDFNEPAVDLDIEQVGIQTGFNLQASGGSTSGVTPAIARHVWDGTSGFSFSNVQGFTTWYQAAVLSSQTAVQSLTTNIIGLNNNHVTEISAWIKAMLQDGFILRRALRHWSDGTCMSPLKLPRSSCLIYDLEPHVPGIQGGFEMNPSSDTSIQASQALREELWDQVKSISFLNQVLASDFATGYGLWLQALNTYSVASIANAVVVKFPSFSATTATAIVTWLRLFSGNRIHTLNVLNWWRSASCLPRRTISSQPGTSTTTSGVSSCSKSYAEVEKSSVVTGAAADESPFSTRQRQLDVSQTDCDFDSATSTYTKTDSTYQISTEEYSCDVLSTELSDDHANEDFKSGFEVGPLLPASQVAFRPSLAVASALWDPLNTFSFRHFSGYKRWVFDYTTNPETRTQLVRQINTQVATECSKITVAGVRSAVFNVTLIGTDASCGQTTLDQVDAIQKWVRGLAQSAWVESALLDQWRRGSLDASLDIEPYRPNKQGGLELAFGCKCTLTTSKGTVYLIPREALALWDATKSTASFLTTQGYQAWAGLLNASAYNDANGISYWKTQIATATSLSSWEVWLDNIASWLSAWRANEHFMRDVLGHWLHGTCATSPTIISITSEPAPTTTTVSSCPSIADRYKVVLNDTLDDILEAASRPTFASYFDPDVVEKTATIKLKKVVEVSEIWVGCEAISASQFTQTVSTRVATKEYASCSLLNVLSEGTTEAVPITQSEVIFEMNRTVESSPVSIEIALAAWDSSQNNPWGFTNTTHFLSLWQPAIHRNEARVALQTAINTAIPSTTTSELDDVTAYLNQWETSSKSTRRVGEAWLQASAPFLDLDADSDGRQVGFELMASFAWRKIAGTSPSSLPNLDQAQYLWDPKNTYSFLNQNAATTARFPVGFNAWREVYEGLDYSSEHLLWVYPEVATTERNAMVPKLSTIDREQLLWLMTNETTLTEMQVRGIAAWVIGWSENSVLQDYLLQLWATNVTPRGEEGAAVDMTRFLSFRFDALLETLTIPNDPLTADAKATLGTLSKSTLRALWDVKQAASLLNPAGRDVWCVLDLPILRICPHSLSDLGSVSENAVKGFISVAKSVLDDVETVARSTNLHNLAISYLKRQFGLNQAQVLTIAKWWRSLPTSSSYYQALQVSRWQNMTDELAIIDLTRFGFGLGAVFSSTKPKVNRRATTADLLDNPGKCTISLSFAATLWNEASLSSFVNKDGMAIWHEYSHQDPPRKANAFLSLIGNRDSTIGTLIPQLDPALAACTIDTIANWVLSWEVHPLTSQFIESLWYQEPTAPASPLRFFSSPSDLLQAFPSSNSDANSLDTTSATIDVRAKVAELVFDPSESVSVGNLTHGFPIWRALLINCSTAEASTGKCKRTSEESVDMIGASALKILASALRERLVDVYPTEPVLLNAVEKMIHLKFVPWLIYWLDHPLLLKHIVKHAIEVDASLVDHAESLSYDDLPAIQFVKATFTRINYSLPIDATDIGSFDEHYGVVSERITRSVLGFDTATQSVKPTNVVGQAGFPELKAFCEGNTYDRVFAYDTIATCSLDTSYHIVIDVAKQLLATFADDQENYSIGIDDAGKALQFRRASLLIDAFLAQPFVDVAECKYLVARLAEAYSITTSEQQNACKPTANGILLDLPLLSSTGFSVSSALFHRTRDFQAYLRYAATKFIFEPSVVGLVPTQLSQEDILRSPPTPSSATDYPIGGFITARTVAQALSPANVKLSLWQTEDLSMPPASFTFLIPSRPDLELVGKTMQRPLGQLILINASPTISVLGVSASLPSVFATDGSQFTTAILTSRRNAASGGKTAFPPSKLTFFWEYSNRIVQASYVKNTTRFGIPLMRYTIDDWRVPTNFPSGVDDAATSDADAPSHSINVTTLFVALPMLLSSAPPMPAFDSRLTPSRDTAIDVDPITGVVYHRRLTWQLTAQVRAADASRDYWHKQLQQGWLPVLWIREQRSVSSTRAAEFLARTSKPGPFATEKLAMWVVVGGCVYVFVGVVASYMYFRRARMVRLRKLQSIVPATAPSSAAPNPPKSAEASWLSSSVSTQVHETSGVEVPPNDPSLSTVTPRARKRTTPTIESIKEVQEDHSDVQQL